VFSNQFLAPKGRVRYFHHFASLIVIDSCFSHFSLFLRNHWNKNKWVQLRWEVIFLFYIGGI